jgi:predicted permease
MNPGTAPWLARRLFALAARAFPSGGGTQDRVEMCEAFGAAAGARFARGRREGWGFTLRASVDVVRQGLVERARRGRVPRGHGAETKRWRRGGMGEGIGMDIRLALRALRRAPGFTFAALAVLGLGIGANATVFSALRVAVLAPPPYPDPGSLVLADLTYQRGEQEPEPLIWSYPKFRMFLETPDRRIDPAVGYAARTATLTDLGPAETIGIEVVSPGYFALLGRTPPLGRGFVDEEIDPGADPAVVVLSDVMWRERFGGDPGVLGSDVTLNQSRLTVVGVAPPDFEGLTGSADLWVPMGITGALVAPFMTSPESAGAHWFHVLGRLTAGSTVEEARAQMTSIGAAISEAYPPPNTSRVFSASARSFLDVRSNERAESAVLFLTLAAGLLLLVACANLSGLLIARARSKMRDAAVRVAVGASRWRLVRASLAESLALAVLGGVVGLGLALGGTRALALLWPARFSGGEDGDLRVTDPAAFGVDVPVLLFAIAVTLLTGLVFGLAPALRASRPDVGERLRDGTGGTRAARGFAGLDVRSLLVGAQVALALVLLIGVGLVAESTRRLLAVDEGFRTERLLTFAYTMPSSSSRRDDPVGFHDELLDEIRAISGVESATVGCPPLRGHCIITRVDAVEGEPEIPPGEGIQIGANMVDDVHFDALGIPVLVGRVFDSSDGRDRQATVVLNETAARELFGDRPAVGRFIELGVRDPDRDRMTEVVGVVGDVLYGRPEDGVMPEAYFSYRDFAEPRASVTVRTRGEPLGVVGDLTAAVQAADPEMALDRLETMETLIASSVGDRRAVVRLLGIFAAITLLLALTGTWSLVAYMVADRRRELGLRIALGARAEGIVRRMLSQGVRAAAGGVLAGLVLGRFVSRLLESLLWEIEPTEPVVYLGGALFLLGTVVLASWLPARRAARVDPVEALKAE